MNMDPQGTVQLPPAYSAYAREVDELYGSIFWLSVALFVGIVGAMLVLLWRYRRRPGRKSKPTGHATVLEIAWTVAPLFPLAWLFHAGFAHYVDGAVAPEGAYEVRVRAMQWSWEFEHPGGALGPLNELTVPVWEPVKLIMSSSDVIHSFFVPGLRVKRDVVPGMYTTLWFEADQVTGGACESDDACPEGQFCGRQGRCALPIYCAEYCGAPQDIQDSAGRNTNHSTMLAELYVVEEMPSFEPIMPERCEAAEDPMACWGEHLYQSNGCVGCHSVDGSSGPGPSWQGLWGSERAFEGGERAVADENYVRQSILQPQAQVVEGYTSVNMPPYRLSDRQIEAIVAYLRTLSE